MNSNVSNKLEESLIVAMFLLPPFFWLPRFHHVFEIDMVRGEQQKYATKLLFKSLPHIDR